MKGEELNPMYWFRNVREPVYFTSAIEAQLNDGFDTFIELGPHPIHAIGVNDLISKKKKKGLVIPSLRRKENEKSIFLSGVSALHTWGCKVDWKSFYGEDNAFIKLPKYPWQKESYWIETSEGKTQRMGTFDHPHLTKKVVSARESNNVLWDITLDKRTYPYIEDHKVQGPIIFPGAGHVDLSISAAVLTFGEKLPMVKYFSPPSAKYLPEILNHW